VSGDSILTTHLKKLAQHGRVKLETEAFDISVSMLDPERLSESIAEIDLSFVE